VNGYKERANWSGRYWSEERRKSGTVYAAKPGQECTRSFLFRKASQALSVRRIQWAKNPAPIVPFIRKGVKYKYKVAIGEVRPKGIPVPVAAYAPTLWGEIESLQWIVEAA